MRLVRRGASLVELIVALTMLGVVATLLIRMLAGNLRVYQSQTQRIDRLQSIRAAETILPAELRELNAAAGDIVAAAPTSITVRAMRQLGFVCAVPRPGAKHLAIRERLFFGVRDFDPVTDALLLYAPDDSAGGDDWIVAPLSGVGRGACDDGAPARLLATSVSVHPTLGAPVRGFEIVTYRLYRAGDGEWHIGLVTGPGGVVQPLIGPMTAGGFELHYQDAAGAAVTDPLRVAAIEIRLRAPTSQALRGPDGTLTRPVDSAVVVVALRGNPRSP